MPRIYVIRHSTSESDVRLRSHPGVSNKRRRCWKFHWCCMAGRLGEGHGKPHVDAHICRGPGPSSIAASPTPAGPHSPHIQAGPRFFARSDTMAHYRHPSSQGSLTPGAGQLGCAGAYYISDVCLRRRSEHRYPRPKLITGLINMALHARV